MGQWAYKIKDWIWSGFERLSYWHATETTTIFQKHKEEKRKCPKERKGDEGREGEKEQRGVGKKEGLNEWTQFVYILRLSVYIRETLEFYGSTPPSNRYLLWALPVSL